MKLEECLHTVIAKLSRIKITMKSYNLKVLVLAYTLMTERLLLISNKAGD